MASQSGMTEHVRGNRTGVTAVQKGTTVCPGDYSIRSWLKNKSVSSSAGGGEPGEEVASAAVVTKRRQRGAGKAGAREPVS